MQGSSQHSTHNIKLQPCEQRQLTIPYTKSDLTKLHKEFSGDTFFPKLDKKWKEINRVNVKADENHECAFSFLTYVKK